MKLLHVAAGALNQTPLAWDSNAANIRAAIQAAKAANVQVLCLPELCITGYGCEDAFHAPGLQSTAWEMLKSIATETSGMVVSVGLPVMYAGGLFNAAALLVDGRIAGFAANFFFGLCWTNLLVLYARRILQEEAIMISQYWRPLSPIHAPNWPVKSANRS